MEEKNKDLTTLNRALETLKKIGVENIRRETNLDCAKIEDILQMRFERLDYVRARGFIDILQRQYHLDLSGWLEAYQASLPKQTPPPPPPPVFRQNLKYYIFLIVLLLVCGSFLVWLFFYSQNSSPKVQQIQRGEVRIEVPQVAEKEQVEVKEEATKQNTKPLSAYGKAVFENFTLGEKESIFWQSPRPLWVGVIELDTQKKSSKIRRQSEIVLDSNLLITTSRGDMVITWREEEKEFDPRFPVYLIYTKEGGLRQISKEEFLFLNGGNEW